MISSLNIKQQRLAIIIRWYYRNVNINVNKFSRYFKLIKIKLKLEKINRTTYLTFLN